MKEKDLPLAGLRVVELADGLGEMCGKMLADSGAEVIKVEPPGGSKSRTMSPTLEIDGQTISCYFEFRNANKKSIELDIENSEQDLEQLKTLLASTDVLIESYKLGRLVELGLGKLSNQFPHLIITSITPFGQTGDYSNYEATNDTLFALSSWLGLSGIPEKPPITGPGYMAYDLGGIMGCFATLVAIIKRYRTGTGQYIDVSALEALAQCGTWGVINASAIINADQPRVRMRSGASPLYALFPTSDGMVRLVILSPWQWKAMWEWLGKPEEFSDPNWEQIFQRILNADVLNPYFAKLFAPMKMEECAEEAQQRGVVVTPMLKPDDILKSDHFISRKTFVETEIANGKKGKLASGWLDINSSKIGLRTSAPKTGEHTEEILSQQMPAIQLEQNPDEEPALKDLRVMDFGHGGVGVEGGKLLAEYGADVIKIESRTYFDFMRIVLGSEMSPSFASSNRSKRSLGVNTKINEGREVLYKLAEISDIVIENNSTGTMKNLGMEYEKLAKLNPRITMSSSQMMGTHGTYSEWIGYGPTISTVGGIDWLWGFDDGDPPPGTPHIHPDHMAGRFCAIAGLLGVISAKKTGEGFHAELAQVENLIYTLGDLFLKESLSSGSVTPQGNNTGGDYSGKDAMWGPVKCKKKTEDWETNETPEWEDWCVICVRNDMEWAALVELMGNPDWTTQPEFADRQSRIANQEEVISKVSNWTQTFTSLEVMEKCQSKNIPAGSMLFPDQLINNPHYVARDFPLAQKQQGLEGTLHFEGAAFKATNLPEAYFYQAPALGQHTRQICEELLGIDEEKIESLIEAGALEIDQ